MKNAVAFGINTLLSTVSYRDSILGVVILKLKREQQKQWHLIQCQNKLFADRFNRLGQSVCITLFFKTAEKFSPENCQRQYSLITNRSK